MSLSFPGVDIGGATQISAADFRKALSKSSKGSKKPPKNKFGSKPVRSDDGYFDSTAEYNRYLELKLMAKAKLITDLRRQVTYSLDVGEIHISNYIADFVYLQDGKQVVEDSKGFRTREYLQKKRLMREIHGIDILETCGKSSSSALTKGSKRGF